MASVFSIQVLARRRCVSCAHRNSSGHRAQLLTHAPYASPTLHMEPLLPPQGAGRLLQGQGHAGCSSGCSSFCLSELSPPSQRSRPVQNHLNSGQGLDLTVRAQGAKQPRPGRAQVKTVSWPPRHLLRLPYMPPLLAGDQGPSQRCFWARAGQGTHSWTGLVCKGPSPAQPD